MKENRSFDHYFGAYPRGRGPEGDDRRLQREHVPGWPHVPLTQARHVLPHDLGHAFAPGLYSINGGKMNGYNCVPLGEDMTGYTAFPPVAPGYWAYADRFVLADHFFTSMFGPTFPEHLYTVAAQSYGIVDNKTNTDTEGNYCDDPQEVTKRFPLEDLTDQDVSASYLEDNITAEVLDQLDRIAVLEPGQLTCINIKTLPDLLERNGISWKYYANADAWMNALQAVRHVRFGPMWQKVQPPDTILDDIDNGEPPAVSWLIPPEEPERAPRVRHERLRG